MRPNDLTEQQERFIKEYNKDRNGKQAAIRAGYSARTADVAASKLLRMPKVNSRIVKVELSVDEPCNEKEAETFDGSSGELVPLLRNPRLATLKDVRLEMAYVYKRMENRIIETSDGSKMIFALGKIADVITVSEFEERIEQLEQQRQELLQDRQRALPDYREA